MPTRIAESDGGGRVTIETGVDNEGDAPRAVISVNDTGKGIREDDLSHIFEPFYTTKGEGQGTGLGLSISDGIIREHGGCIDVESAVGRRGLCVG